MALLIPPEQMLAPVALAVLTLPVGAAAAGVVAVKLLQLGRHALRQESCADCASVCAAAARIRAWGPQPARVAARAPAATTCSGVAARGPPERWPRSGTTGTTSLAGCRPQSRRRQAAETGITSGASPPPPHSGVVHCHAPQVLRNLDRASLAALRCTCRQAYLLVGASTTHLRLDAAALSRAATGGLPLEGVWPQVQVRRPAASPSPATHTRAAGPRDARWRAHSALVFPQVVSLALGPHTGAPPQPQQQPRSAQHHGSPPPASALAAPSQGLLWDPSMSSHAANALLRRSVQLKRRGPGPPHACRLPPTTDGAAQHHSYA